MEQLSGENSGQERYIWKVIAASVVGTVLEWYDFVIYGIAAGLVFSQLFFPELSSTAGTLASLATFGVGFFARPIGGIVFGHLGDKFGRKPILITTLALMGIATTLIGLLPTYATIGIWAPILLVVLRLLQGFGAGAEFGGASLMVTESTTRRRGFYGSFIAMGVILSTVLGSGIFTLLTSLLTEEQLLAWGWRVPFLLGIIFLGVGFYIRLRILETPAFTRMKETHTEARVPLLTAVRNSPKSLLIAFCAPWPSHGYSYIIKVFLLSYITIQLGLSAAIATTALLVGKAFEVFTIPTAGALSDRFGRRKLYMGFSAFLALLAFPFWWLVNTEVPILIVLAFVLAFSFGLGPIVGLQPAFFSELFDTQNRYSGFVLTRELSGALVGGTSPVIAAALIAWAGGATWAAAVYMIIMAVVPLIAVYFAPETLHKTMSPETAPEKSSQTSVEEERS